MKLSRTTKILYIILALITIFVLHEYNRTKWWYEKSPVLCRVIAKEVRQENENKNDSRSTQMTYINHLFVEYNGIIYDKPVGNTSYYHINLGQQVYHDLSPDDMNGGHRTDGEEAPGCIAFLIGFVIVIVLVIRHFKTD